MLLELIYYCVILSLFHGSFAYTASYNSTTVSDYPKRAKYLNEADSEKRVYGGSFCSTNTYPFMVLILDGSHSRKCGGTLLSEKLVLTAAHCIFPNMYVAAAVSDLKPIIEKVERTYIHPKYDPLPLLNDIAILRLEKSIEKSKYVDFVTLPKVKAHKNVKCETVLIMGWGFVAPGIMHRTLQCANLPVITLNACNDLYNSSLDRYGDTILCTLSTEGKDSCEGDSGGPLLCKGEQVGIISWGQECGHSRKPSVATRVDRYLDFIRKTRKQAAKNGSVEYRRKWWGRFMTMMLILTLYVILMVVHGTLA